MSTIMQSQDILKLGLTGEALAVLAAAMTDNMLRQLQAKSLAVADPGRAPVQATDVQTVNMEADADAKRKAEATDDDDDKLTDVSICSDQKDLDEVQQSETGDKPAGTSKITRRDKKDLKARTPASQSSNSNKSSKK